MTTLIIPAEYNTQEFRQHVYEAITGEYPVVGVYKGSEYLVPNTRLLNDGRAIIEIATGFDDKVCERLIAANVSYGTAYGQGIEIKPDNLLQIQLNAQMPPQRSARARLACRP